jgi:hypothetical protein
MSTHSNFVVAAAAVVLAISALSGCSRSDDSPPPSGTAPQLPSALAPVYDEVTQAFSNSPERKELAGVYLARIGDILTATDRTATTDAFVALLKLVDCRGEAGADVAKAVNDAVSKREELKRAIEARIVSTKASVIQFADECAS